MPTDRRDPPGEEHTWSPEWEPALGATFATLPPVDLDEPAGEAVPVAPERYEWSGQLGQGGMGEVWRVRDRELGRVVAMKVLKRELLRSERALGRFREEAQVAAQLQHPGIVPVHDIGRLPDGRVFFTMKEVRGRTLEDVVRDVHRAKRGAALGLRRTLDAFLRVCEAVAYAHHRGVVHRDLKPANVMIGDFGEVLVLDWGLARVLGEVGPLDERVETDRGDQDALRTRVGTVTGTPAYMAPEQARGARDEVGPRSDVYALGASLYEVLTDRPPYLGHTVDEVLAQVVAGDPIAPPSRVSGVPVPEELDRICLRALSADPADRYPDATALADELGAWLDGARKHDRALEIVTAARDRLDAIEAIEARARALREEARQELEGVAETAPEAQKWPAWDLEDQARALDAEAQRGRTEALMQLQSALTHDPDCAEAHEALAGEYHRRHAALEAKGQRDEAERLEPWLRAHDRGEYAAYLRGDGAVTLVTDPEGAEVDLYRFELQRRRLVPVFVRTLGRTPLGAVPLPMGSYVLKIRAEGRVEVTYPVMVGRGEHWDGVAPGEREAFPIHLPRPDELEPDDVYVPAGWFWCGGELEQLTDPVPWRRVWAHPFVIKRHPVTNAEYLAFLNDLVAQGREEEALKHAPRMPSKRPGEEAQQVYRRQPDGRFALGADEDGDAWLPDMPVVRIDWYAAEAHAAWHAARTKQPWRLPFELEWEKAARGVDGRVYPWGEEIDPSWCRIKTSWTDQPGPVSVHAHPQDISVYGARGMVGNVSVWTLDPRPGGCEVVGSRVAIGVAEALARRLRGGSYAHNPWWCRIDVRKMQVGRIGGDQLGYRILREAKFS